MSACPFHCLSALPFHACLSVYLSAYPSACMPACLLAYLTVSHSKWVHACLCACVRVCLCACLPVCLHVCLPGCLLLFACFVYAFPLHLLNEFFFFIYISDYTSCPTSNSNCEAFWGHQLQGIQGSLFRKRRTLHILSSLAVSYMN